jgi:hypothetical protein
MPQKFLAQDDSVVSIGRYTASVRGTGAHTSSDSSYSATELNVGKRFFGILSLTFVLAIVKDSFRMYRCCYNR